MVYNVMIIIVGFDVDWDEFVDFLDDFFWLSGKMCFYFEKLEYNEYIL